MRDDGKREISYQILAWTIPGRRTREVTVNRRLSGRWLLILTGVYVMLSPWITTHRPQAETISDAIAWSHYLAGGAMITLGFIGLAVDHLWEDWMATLVGVWLVVSPWLLGFTSIGTLAWSDTLMGIIVIVLSIRMYLAGLNI